VASNLVQRLFTLGALDISKVTEFLKPAFSLRKPKVEDPYQGRIRIVAYAPKNYIENSVKSLYRDMKHTYGNIALWVSHSKYVEDGTWNLRKVKATHTINIYGEKSYADEFIQRLNEAIGDVSSVENNETKLVSYQGNGSESTGTTPVTLAKNLITTKSDPGWQSLLNPFIGLFGVLLALMLLNGGKRDEKKFKGSSLKTAKDSVSSFVSDPVVLAEKRVGKKTQYDVSGYDVLVDERGAVTSVKKG
jgi:hypothetical protein